MNKLETMKENKAESEQECVAISKNIESIGKKIEDLERERLQLVSLRINRRSDIKAITKAIYQLKEQRNAYQSD